jgi:hypothetical protein
MGDGVVLMILKPAKVSTPGADVAASNAACEVKTVAAWATPPRAVTAKMALDEINEANKYLNFIDPLPIHRLNNG